jgi:hypothetical protein
MREPEETDSPSMPTGGAGAGLLRDHRTIQQLLTELAFTAEDDSLYLSLDDYVAAERGIRAMLARYAPPATRSVG